MHPRAMTIRQCRSATKAATRCPRLQLHMQNMLQHHPRLLNQGTTHHIITTTRTHIRCHHRARRVLLLPMLITTISMVPVLHHRPLNHHRRHRKSSPKSLTQLVIQYFGKRLIVQLQLLLLRLLPPRLRSKMLKFGVPATMRENQKRSSRWRK